MDSVEEVIAVVDLAVVEVVASVEATVAVAATVVVEAVASVVAVVVVAEVLVGEEVVVAVEAEVSTHLLKLPVVAVLLPLKGKDRPSECDRPLIKTLPNIKRTHN